MAFLPAIADLPEDLLRSARVLHELSVMEINIRIKQY